MSIEKPLAGLKVADFSMVYAGPICARMLSDCGAAVTKIEPLGLGDTVRGNTRISENETAFCIEVCGPRIEIERADKGKLIIHDKGFGVDAKERCVVLFRLS